MPSWLMTLLSSMPEGTPKIHFIGVKFPLISIEGSEGSVKVVDQSAGVCGFYDNLVDVSFDQVILYLIVKALLDGTLICGPDIF